MGAESESGCMRLEEALWARMRERGMLPLCGPNPSLEWERGWNLAAVQA